MLQKLNTKRGGFTLVEIMIVVAIIALLAAIAVPGFLRARKRAQATKVLNEARIIEGAIEQYAIEGNKAGGNTVATAGLKGFFKPNSDLYIQAGKGGALVDNLGGTYTISTFDAGVKVDSGTIQNFSDVIDEPDKFWTGYK